MPARIIAVTQPRIRPDNNDSTVKLPFLTPDEFIAYVARVSNPSNQHNLDTAPKLINYLIAHQHWSPFEMVHIVMEIDTTRDIGRQILRHRSFSFQEFSQRYAEVNTVFYTRDARLQDTKNRQNSIDVDDSDLQTKWSRMQHTVTSVASDAYNWALKNGIAKEVARAVLPEGLTHTKMYMSGSLRSWIHYCQLRMDKGTQKEHREIAEECWKQIVSEFPSVASAIDLLPGGKVAEPTIKVDIEPTLVDIKTYEDGEWISGSHGDFKIVNAKSDYEFDVLYADGRLCHVYAKGAPDVLRMYSPQN